jgi:hypothetical protein
MPSSVLSPRVSSSVSSSTLASALSSLSTTLSWPPTWPIKLSCMRGRQASTARHHRLRYQLLNPFFSVPLASLIARSVAACSVHNPRLQGLLEGMNQFLRQMEITFRRDPENFRPRINKMDRCRMKCCCQSYGSVVRMLTVVLQHQGQRAKSCRHLLFLG